MAAARCYTGERPQPHPQPVAPSRGVCIIQGSAAEVERSREQAALSVLFDKIHLFVLEADDWCLLAVLRVVACHINSLNWEATTGTA